MIPVVVMDKDGKEFYQVFNDNLAPEEQINRKLLAALFKSQDKLTNVRDQVSRNISNGVYDAAKIGTVNTAASTLLSAIETAIAEFEKAI